MQVISCILKTGGNIYNKFSFCVLDTQFLMLYNICCPPMEKKRKRIIILELEIAILTQPFLYKLFSIWRPWPLKLFLIIRGGDEIIKMGSSCCWTQHLHFSIVHQQYTVSQYCFIRSTVNEFIGLFLWTKEVGKESDGGVNLSIESL